MLFMVKVKFLGKENKNYMYLIENTDHVNLNCIRRTISYFLPVYAIDDIDFYDNNSVVFDEMLANRIGLLPITNPLLNTGKKVTFNLEIKGPLTVYSKDLVSNDPEVKMVYDTIPLTKLNEGEQIKLVAYANLGKGKEHIKHMPAIVSYSQLYELESSRKCEECKEVFEKASLRAIKSESTKNILMHPDDYDLCVSKVEACDKKCLKINPTNNYILNVEVIGQINTVDLFKLTDRHLKESIAVLKKKIK